MSETSTTPTPLTSAQLQEHYEVERGLATQLRNAPREERRALYTFLYEELFRLIPFHPQLTQKQSTAQQQKVIQNQMTLLGPLLNENKTFLEVGPGDCALALHVAGFVQKVYAVDVSQTITKTSATPANFTLVLSDGCSVPVPENSIDVIYSNQLMEHLHPDDAQEQLTNIFKALAPGGVYLCITPNQLNGPHDISKYFGSVATGFHLKEYSIRELSELFSSVGFSKLVMYIGAKGKYLRVPVSPLLVLEDMLRWFPAAIRRKLASTKLVDALINIRIIGMKPN